MAWTFLDSAARRLEEVEPRALSEFERMRHAWEVIRRTGVSTGAIHDLWQTLEERWRGWHGPDGEHPADAREHWLTLVRACLASTLKVNEAVVDEGVIDELVGAARDRLLLESLEWHLAVLKEQLEA